METKLVLNLPVCLLNGGEEVIQGRQIRFSFFCRISFRHSCTVILFLGAFIKRKLKAHKNVVFHCNFMALLGELIRKYRFYWKNKMFRVQKKLKYFT